MKKNIKLFSVLLIGGTIFLGACKKSDDTPVTVYYQGGDQMGRPAINTVFVTAPDKDVFNATIPSAMGAAFQSKFQTHLMALNPGYTTNLLGLDAATFTGVLSTDVLTASTTGPTKFFTSTTDYLTGRGLADDVITNELTLIFAGPMGTPNQLSDDHVDANDKPFLTSFPYEAAPW